MDLRVFVGIQRFPDLGDLAIDNQHRRRLKSLLREAGGGREYDSRFGVRQTGRGPYAEMLSSRFEAASRRFGLQPQAERLSLDCDQFLRPGPEQLGLGI